ncbi:MAG: aspartate carbamoyltransferase [Candidatus Norongarragalinales archaeon]
MGSLKGRDLISINDFADSEVQSVLETAAEMEEAKHRPTTLCQGKVLATLFFEPSTRTQFSFQTAMLRLGGSAIGFSDTSGTSVAKGETLQDTIRIIDGYADVIAMRHSQPNSLSLAAEYASIPVISGGEGKGEHPTQTLLDLYTIKKELGRLDVNIGFYGDLKYGRTVHSLIMGASRFGANFYCIAPPSLQMPGEYVKKAEAKGSRVEFCENVSQIAGNLDVLYVTRLQKERLSPQDDYQKLKSLYHVDNSLLSKMKPKSIVMHPLPRIGEIEESVDGDLRAAYFRQAANGVPVRMALIALLLGAK